MPGPAVITSRVFVDTQCATQRCRRVSAGIKASSLADAVTSVTEQAAASLQMSAVDLISFFLYSLLFFWLLRTEGVDVFTFNPLG